MSASPADANAVWEYKTGNGLEVHSFYFPYYQNQPGQNCVIHLSKNKNLQERKSFGVCPMFSGEEFSSEIESHGS